MLSIRTFGAARVTFTVHRRSDEAMQNHRKAITQQRIQDGNVMRFGSLRRT